MRWKATVLLMGMVFLLMGCKPQEDHSNFYGQGEPSPALDENNEGRAPVAVIDPTVEPSESFPVLLVLSEGDAYEDIVSSVRVGFLDWMEAATSSFSAEGIAFKMIELRLDGALPDASADLTRAIIEHKPVLIVGALPLRAEIVEVFNGAEIPVLSFGLGSEKVVFGNQAETIFSLVPDADEQAAFVVSEIWRNWTDVTPTPLMTQVNLAYAHAQNEASSNGGLFKGFLLENGYTLSVEVTNYSDGGFDAANFLMDARFAQSTLIYLDGAPGMMAAFLRDVSNLALSEFFVISSSAWAIDQDVLDLMAEIESTPEIIIPLPVVWWQQADHPAIILADELLTQSDRDGGKKDLGYLMGLAAADIAATSILAASVQSGGRDLAGGDVEAALGGLEDYEAANGLLTVDFSGGNRAANWLRLWIVDQNGNWEPIGEGGTVPDLD